MPEITREKLRDNTYIKIGMLHPVVFQYSNGRKLCLQCFLGSHNDCSEPKICQCKCWNDAK